MSRPVGGALTQWVPQLSHHGVGRRGGFCGAGSSPHTHTCSGGPEVLRELVPECLLMVAAPSAGHLHWLSQGRGVVAWRETAGPEGRALGDTAISRRAAPPTRSFLNFPLRSLARWCWWQAIMGLRGKMEVAVSGCGHRTVACVTPGAMSSPARPRPGPGPGRSPEHTPVHPSELCSPQAGPAPSPQLRLRGWQICGG